MAGFDILLQSLAPDVGNTPQLDAPTLADLSREIDARPLWMLTEKMPFEVELETFKKARTEMIDIQCKRGFPLASAAIDRENFLLRGVPVVVKDEA